MEIKDSINRKSLIDLIHETLFNGIKHVDKVVDNNKNGNTLLHLAVILSLPKEVALLLSAGARSDIKNYHGYTAYEIALRNGNQLILQILNRKDEFQRYIDESRADCEIELIENFTYNVYYSLPQIYDDYLDWNESKRLGQLQVNYFTFIFKQTCNLLFNLRLISILLFCLH
jgi:ankyrin repeat protein